MYKLFKLILLFVVVAFASAPEMKLERVSRNIYMVRGVDAPPSLENRGFRSNAYAVLTKEGWVVVDALSTPELSKEFVENLYRVGTHKVRHNNPLPSRPLVWCKNLQIAWSKDNSPPCFDGGIQIWSNPEGFG